MKELKIRVWNEKNIVLMEVIDQDESLRNKKIIYKAKNGIEIVSWFRPDIVGDGIYIRGKCKELDKQMCYRDFRQTYRAEEYVEMVKEAVEEFNNTIKEVLDKEEKEYLSAVIRPFRKETEYITKYRFGYNIHEYIAIRTKECFFTLPHFVPGTIYKGMELERKYTLEELGL